MDKIKSKTEAPKTPTGFSGEYFWNKPGESRTQEELRNEWVSEHEKADKQLRAYLRAQNERVLARVEKPIFPVGGGRYAPGIIGAKENSANGIVAKVGHAASTIAVNAMRIFPAGVLAGAIEQAATGGSLLKGAIHDGIMGAYMGVIIGVKKVITDTFHSNRNNK